jgi:hypothetical protein
MQKWFGKEEDFFYRDMTVEERYFLMISSFCFHKQRKFSKRVDVETGHTEDGVTDIIRDPLTSSGQKPAENLNKVSPLPDDSQTRMT